MDPSRGLSRLFSGIRSYFPGFWAPIVLPLYQPKKYMLIFTRRAEQPSDTPKCSNVNQEAVPQQALTDHLMGSELTAGSMAVVITYL